MTRISLITSAFLLLLVSFSIMITGTGCAGITPPLGGPRDSLPPVIVFMNPKDSTLAFTGKKVEIRFDEYVQVEDLQKNLLINPTPKVNPTVEAKLKAINITIRDTLEENTTYSIDFGNAIQDINEGNPLRNFKYTFSTGRYLDSLNLSGRVIVAETGRVDSTLIVILHTSLEDSAVAKDRPRYVTRLDTTGRFTFHNLAPGKFAIYALKDEGGQRRYLSKEQLFAFYDSTVTSQSEKSDIVLYAYKGEDTTKREQTGPAPATEKRGNADRYLKVQSNATEEKDLLTPLVLTFSEPLSSFDSTKLLFSDSTFKPITNYRLLRDTSNQKISLFYEWPENTPFNVILDTAFAEDTLGHHIAKADTISFTTKQNTDYGLVDLRFSNLPLALHPILLFVQGEDIKYTHVFTNNRFTAKLFQPGEYELRIVYDSNQNGKWDTGDFFEKHIQPEKVQLVPRRINIRPNWDTEIDIDL